jgi:hypothetical protein
LSPLTKPPSDLFGFPEFSPLPSPLFRIHQWGRDAWWFTNAGGGRFDINAPKGACYVADDPLGAYVEVFRDVPLIPEAEVLARRLAELEAPTLRIADCCSRKARRFGVTAAIHSTENYALTQEWARAFEGAGFDGIRYRVSHDPAQRLIGFALFSTAGGGTWPAKPPGPIPSDLIARARRIFGIQVVP